MSNLFVRKATGMVRSWSVFDAFIYAFFSINFVTLGFYAFSQMYYFGGGSLGLTCATGAAPTDNATSHATRRATTGDAGRRDMGRGG